MSSIQVQKLKTQPQNGAQVTVKNQTSSRMTLARSINWSGNPAEDIPTNIPAGDYITFIHLSDGDFGSRGSVVYSGTNLTGLPCAWVFAWDAPANSDSQTPNKVYVTCGSKEIIDAIDFNQIRLSLSVSKADSSAQDIASNTSASADINDQVVNKATAGASFSLMP